jgi:hypothetical protein
MAQLQLIKQSSGILIPATPETSELLQSKIKLGAVLVADFKQVRNPAFHRRFFALLNLGFEYWEPTGGAISSNERKLVTGYAKFLASYGGNESALMDAAEQYLDRIADKRTGSISACKSFDAYRAWVTIESGHYDAIQLPDGTLRKHPAVLPSPIWTKPSSSNSTKRRLMSFGAGYCPGHSGTSAKQRTQPRN